MREVIRTVLLLGSLSICAQALAVNGINLFGFGTESTNFGGADAGLSRDTSALNANPAGLDHTQAHALDMNLSLGKYEVTHRDQFGNDVRSLKNDILLGTFGYAQRLNDFTFGVGLFAQGGVGVQFPAINTAFGTQDTMKSIIRIARLNLGVAYHVDEQLSLGFSASNVLSDLDQELFPNTSFYTGNIATSFFGNRIYGAKSSTLGYKMGMQYKLSSDFTLGVAYTNPVKVKYKDGQFVSNQSSIGLGQVTYRDMLLEGIDQPQELAVGFAWNLDQNWLWVFELNWIEWSKAIQTSHLVASNPDTVGAPAVIENYTPHNWRDQYVFSTGIAYQWDAQLTLRSGYNYGRNPVPNETLSPLLAPITEHHLMLGLSYHYAKAWTFDALFEYDKAAEATYTNPNLPFGSNTYTRNHIYGLHLAALYRW